MERGRSNSSCECVSSNPLNSCLVYTIPGGVLCLANCRWSRVQECGELPVSCIATGRWTQHFHYSTVQSATYCHFFVVTLFCVIFVCVAVVHLNQIETDCLFVARSLHFSVKANDNRTEQEEWREYWGNATATGGKDKMLRACDKNVNIVSLSHWQRNKTKYSSQIKERERERDLQCQLFVACDWQTKGLKKLIHYYIDGGLKSLN